MPVIEDIVSPLGHLMLGTRLRRLGERLQADTQQIIDEAGLDIQTTHYPVLAAIDAQGPLTVGELAQAVGISQPGITRTVSQLVALGYLDLTPTEEDQRRKLATLTDAGLTLVDHSKLTVWPRVEQAVATLCGELEGPLLDQLAAIETGLADAPLRQRAASSDQTSGTTSPADKSPDRAESLDHEPHP